MEELLSYERQAMSTTAPDIVQSIEDGQMAVKVEDATIPRAQTETSSSPRTPQRLGWPAYSTAPWETPDTPDPTNWSSPCLNPKLNGEEAAAMSSSVLEKCSELLAAVTSSQSSIFDELRMRDVQPADLDDVLISPFELDSPQALSERKHPIPTYVQPRGKKRKAVSPLPETRAATKHRIAFSPFNAKPIRRPRRSEVELLLDAARRFGYTDLPDL